MVRKKLVVLMEHMHPGKEFILEIVSVGRKNRNMADASEDVQVY